MKLSLKVSPRVKTVELAVIFASAWPGRKAGAAPLRRILRQALFYVCAYDGKQLIGFVKVIGDGGVHGFLLDPTVAPSHQRHGVGQRLVEKCAVEARRRGLEWLHVDYEPRLGKFYRACGFSATRAGLRNLKM